MTKRYRQEESELPQRNNKVQAIGRGTHLLGRAAFERAGFADNSLVLRWDEIAGSEVARMARPLKLVGTSSGGVLTLKAEPAASVFLQHESRSLCARINAYLGRQAVQRVRFVFGEVARGHTRVSGGELPRAEIPPDDPACGFDGPDPLKKALIGLAEVRRAAHPRND